jgi:hypothetical protein
LDPQRTLLTDAAGRYILESLALCPVLAFSKRLSGWTGVGVGLRIIEKQTFRKNLPPPLLFVLSLL